MTVPFGKIKRETSKEAKNNQIENLVTTQSSRLKQHNYNFKLQVVGWI
jgi:hypothetical protein